MSLIPATVNPDLIKERQKASFDIDEFAAWFYGGKELVDIKRILEEELFADAEDNLDHEYLSYEDTYNAGVRQCIKAATKLKVLQERFNPGGSEIFPTQMGGPVGQALIPAGNPLAVHVVMFTRVLKSQGTPEQYEKFGKRSANFEILGTYAQTELGHGTYLRGLESRADYDRKTQEFILNTPTLTSYKWWPGGLGHTVNYCIFVAHLYIDNEHKGMHMFMLQVRDEKTHQPLPGIDIGDIGKKIGMLAVNNGYLGLKNVRVPRTNMLMKNAQVLPDGTYIKSPVSQLSYMPMVFVRCMVAIGNALMLTQASVIAARYSAVRRQSPINENEPEPQIMDHVTQQMKIFPEIATGIAYRVAAGHLIKLHDKTLEEINTGNFSRMTELHALACILKVSCSYDSSYGIERLRQSCGGHGYLTAANLGNLFTTATAACTYEGENMVLYLQVGKILIRTWDDVMAGKKLMPTMAYLGECAAMKQFPKWTGDWHCLVRALQYAATNKTRVVHKNYHARLEKGQTKAEAANNSGVEMAQAAELHGRAFVTHSFLEEVTGNGAAKRSHKLNKVLEQLLELYLIVTVQRHMGDILRFIDLSETDISDLQTRLETLLRSIRPNAIAITDGFDYRDQCLGSCLGCYDGNVYERIFESTKKNPLNQKTVVSSFEQYLKPFMKSNL